MNKKSNIVKVGLVQMSCTEEVELNLQKGLKKIEEAASQGAKIIALQELFRSQYFCQTEDVAQFDLAETIPGPSTEQLSALAKKLDVVIVASLFEKRTEGIYHNTSVVVDADGSLLGKYRKMHIPDDPNFYEKFYFTPGDLGFQTYQTKYGCIGVLICWDQWFPEAARLTAMRGAEILFYPTAIGWHQSENENVCEGQHEAWEVIQRSHAVANGVFVASVNRVGLEGELKFWGQSFIADPFGKVLHRADVNNEELLIVDCDLAQIENTRQNWPFLRDRRIDAYDGLTQRYLD